MPILSITQTNDMYICLRRLTITLALTFVGALVGYAQDVEYDYRQYKFYAETEDNGWWLEAVMREDDTRNRGTQNYAPNADYMLSVAGFSRRGIEYRERRYMAGGLDVDYSTVRLLGCLGLRHDGENRYLQEQEERYYTGQYLRAEFSGCNYTGGISHRGRYKPLRDGVALKDGWSFAHYARARTGRDLYVDGVYTNAMELSAIASYRDRRNWLNIAVMLPWSERGLRQASVEEAYLLTDNRMYNPSWGFQDGKMRNSRVATSLRPEVMAHWQRRLSVATELNITANIYFDRRGYTTLAWFDTRNPQPDNYRYLPSYYADDNISREVHEAWLANDPRYTQIDWDGLYHTNALQSDDVARYAVENRRDDGLRADMAAIFSSKVGSIDLLYGVELNYHTSHNFKVMDDLLGADHIVDIDYYLVDDATYSNRLQNNLRQPNRIIGEGDRFGYDYRLSRLSASAVGAVLRKWDDMSIKGTLRVGFDHTRRRGYYEKELFKGDGSYGLSRGLATNPYSANIAWCYNPGNHAITAAVAVCGESPEAEDMFLQTEYNNRIVEGYRLRTTVDANIGYGYVAHKFSLAAMLFFSARTNELDVIHYYDDIAGLYSDAVVRDIGHLNLGVELSAKVHWSQHLHSTFMLTAARYRYVGNAEVEIYADTTNDLIALTHAPMRGLHRGLPELSVYGDITLSHSGWVARISLGYCGLRHVAPSILRRTDRVTSYAPSPELAEAFMAEQRLSDAVTLDANLSKRIRLKEGMSLGLQLSVRNILGSRFVRSGYEQNRIERKVLNNSTYIYPFANRLTYAYPRTFYLAASLYF